MTRCAATVAALAFALAAAAPANAGPTVATAGVRGGAITGLAWDPTHATTVWAGVGGAGLFQSSNGGAAWSQILLPTVAAHVVNKVLPSTAAADLLFVCEGAPSDQAIWRSGNGAVSFAGVLPTSSGSCTSIIDSTTSGTLYAGIQDVANAARLYKSVDSGKTWTQLSLSLPGVFVSDIVKLPSNRVVIGVRDGAAGVRGANNAGSLYYSDDEGAHWTVGTGIGTGAVAAIGFNGTNTLIALTTNGTNATLYTSADGAAWSAGLSLAAGGGGGAIAYHAGSDTFFLMPTNDQLLQSAAGAGYSFGAAMNHVASLSMPVPFSIGHHTAFAVDPAATTHILVGDVAGGEGIFSSQDGGGVWMVSNDGLFAATVDFAFKTPSGYRYAANGSGFVWFAPAALDMPWLRVYRATDLTRDPVTAMTYDTADDKHLVTAQSNLGGFSLLRSLPDATNAPDEGSPFTHSSWTTLTYPDASSNPVLALLVDGMTLFAGVAKPNTNEAGQYLYTSTNGGTSWTPTSLAVVGGVRALAFDPSNHMTLFAGAGDFKGAIHTVANAGGLWKSTDGGAHFSRISASNATLDGEAPRTIVVDPMNGMRVGSTPIAPAASPAPTATSSRASTAARAGRRSRRPARCSPSPTRPPKISSPSRRAAPASTSTSRRPATAATRGIRDSACTAKRTCCTPDRSAPAVPPASTRRPASWPCRPTVAATVAVATACFPSTTPTWAAPRR